MNLEDTIEGMLSADYKERFKAEYYQAQTRIEKLQKVIGELKNKKVKWEPKSSVNSLRRQLKAMVLYLEILEVRADEEGIKL